MMGTIQPGYISIQGFSALNTTQGPKPIYQQDIYIDSIQKDGDDPTWLYISTQGFSALNTPQGHKHSYQQAIYPKGWGRSNGVKPYRNPMYRNSYV